jgi:hypothetical protein
MQAESYGAKLLMSRYLREIDLAAKRPLSEADATVESMSRVVCALLVRGLPRLETDGFWKLLIGLNDADYYANGKTIAGVLRVNRRFVVKDFLSDRLEHQQEVMLKFVSSVLGEVLEERGLDTSGIPVACDFVRKSGFKNVFERKAQAAPFDGLKARVVCEQEMLCAKIFLEIGKRKFTERYFLCSTHADEFRFQIYFGSIEWVSPQQLLLNVADGTKVEVQRMPH